MSEKARALVIRLADFSESSRVVTLFSREFGKVACLAKGAKRLKSAFDSALDLLSLVDVVFFPKDSGLSLLTEARLARRFHPAAGSLPHLYGGYYAAELLDGLTEPDDPHPGLFDCTLQLLDQLGQAQDPRIPILAFELNTLREIGHLPNVDTCEICHTPVNSGRSGRYWVSQGGLICAECGRPQFEHTEIHPETIAALQLLAAEDNLTQPEGKVVNNLTLAPQQYRELRKLLTAMMAHVLGRKPRMLSFLKF